MPIPELSSKLLNVKVYNQILHIIRHSGRRGHWFQITHDLRLWGQEGRDFRAYFESSHHGHHLGVRFRLLRRRCWVGCFGLSILVFVPWDIETFWFEISNIGVGISWNWSAGTSLVALTNDRCHISGAGGVEVVLGWTSLQVQGVRVFWSVYLRFCQQKSITFC